MKVALIRAYDFPIGGAPQNRWLGILRGLVDQKCSVEAHVFTPAKLDEDLNRKPFQIYKGIPIYNHGWRWAAKKSIFCHFFGIIEGYFKTIFAILKSHRKEPIDWFFFNNNKNMYVFPFFIIAKLFKVKLLRELNEFPLYVLNPEMHHPMIQGYLKRTNYIWFDAFIFMTKELVNFYMPLAKKNAKYLKLPMTVDMDRFPCPVQNYGEPWNITYCGDLSQKKDGVLDLLQAYAMIKDEFPQSRLVLIGSNKNEDYMNVLNKTVKDLDLSKQITFTGYINSEDIPKYLYNSRVLVLCRPDSKQAQGGFPTKLGEYLATGIPVVTTGVGEIPEYLIDGVNAYLVKPGDIEQFAQQMRQCLNDINKAGEIGLQGRSCAEEHFSHKKQGPKLDIFLNNF